MKLKRKCKISKILGERCVNLARKMSNFHISRQILHGNALLSGKNTHMEIFYTTAGRDGRDKYQGCAYDVVKDFIGTFNLFNIRI